MLGSISDWVVNIILPYRQAGSPVTFCSAASFSLRGCRVPSKALFTAKQLTLFGSFPNCSFKASRRKKKRKRGEKGDRWLIQGRTFIKIMQGRTLIQISFRRGEKERDPSIQERELQLNTSWTITTIGVDIMLSTMRGAIGELTGGSKKREEEKEEEIT